MFYLGLDVSDLIKLEAELVPTARKVMEAAVRDLSAQTHAHVVEQVQARLHSTREKYLENLGFHQVSADTWVVELQPGAFFVEEGLPANHEMIDDLLNDGPKPGRQKQAARGKTKTAADGSRYRTIPFQHNKGPTGQTRAAQDLTETIKSELKRMGAPYGKLEVGSDGKPKLGLVRSFDIAHKPAKTHEGAGQGWGGIGQVRQGATGIPFLQGVRIYQKPVPDGRGGSAVKKAIMTFRTVSTKHKGTGRWTHPGLEPKRFLDEAFDWALDQWEHRIKPQVAAKIADSL
jgi:hypothetical protein